MGILYFCKITMEKRQNLFNVLEKMLEIIVKIKITYLPIANRSPRFF